MNVRVLFFGPLREITGVSRDTAECRQGDTLGSLFDRYAERFPAMAAMRQSIVLARNREFREKWQVGRIGVIHRLGRLEIGDASVVIVITSAHRAAAFEACRYAIDRLKKTVPIWKKEFFEDGEVWVEGEVIGAK